jgi:hypothetical protein
MRKHWKDIFLKTLEATGSVKAACDAARITRSAAYKARAQSALFREEWKDAMDAAIGELERKAFEMARDGKFAPMKFLLQSHWPETYRQPARTVTMKFTPQELDKMTDEQINELYRKYRGLIKGFDRGPVNGLPAIERTDGEAGFGANGNAVAAAPRSAGVGAEQPSR